MFNKDYINLATEIKTLVKENTIMVNKLINTIEALTLYYPSNRYYNKGLVDYKDNPKLGIAGKLK